MMMEDCKYIQDLLPFYLDDDVLTVAERKAVEQHIAHCEACEQELKDMQQNASLLHLMGRSIFQAPSDLSLRVMEQLRAENSGSILSEVPAIKKMEKPKIFSLRQRRLVSGIAAAALLALTVAGGTSYLLPDEPATQVAQEETSSQSPLQQSSSNQTDDVLQSDTVEVPEETPPANEVLPNEAEETESSSETANIPDSEPPAPASENHTTPAVSQPLPSYAEPSSNLVLLNQNDQIRSTLLKMSFTDVEAAVLQLQTSAADCGGKIVDTTVSSDSNCEIFTIKVPREQADNFIVSITSSGFVLSQEQDFKTSLYSQLMEEYLQLQAQLSSSKSEEVSVQLKTQLAEVEQQMNAAQQDAQYESVVIWVQLAE